MGNDNRLFSLVTGSSTGIGRAVARELASRGHNLILAALPDQGLPALCSEIKERSGTEVLCFEVDLTSENGPESLFHFIQEKNCRVNILVNNAGIGFEGPIDSYTVKQIDWMILLNVRALTMLTYFLAPELKSHDRSYLLNISSFGCYTPTAYKSIYLATKSYIYYFTRALESELKRSSLHTCVVVPSGVRTNAMVLDRIERNGWFAKKTALTPEEVALSGIKGMFKGRKVIIPGTFTNIFFVLGMFVPEGIVLWMTRRIFRNYRQEK